MNYENDKYFAKDEADKAVEHLISKSSEWFRNIQLNKYLDKIKRSWSAYHGIYYENSHELSFGGEQEELVNLAINHYRNLAQHMLNMVTGSRPVFQARAVNTDKKSLIQADLANGLLGFYMREKRLERFLKKAVEYAITMGSGYIKMEWNATRGEIYDYVEPDPRSIKDYNEDGEPLDENGNVIEPTPIYQGDLEFRLLSPFDVVFDSTKEDAEYHDWVLCRSYMNKFDLAAKYPELEEKIKNLKTKDKETGKRLTVAPYDETNDVPVYEFFHKSTEALPNGRYLLYLDSDIILEDAPMIYDRLPVYRIAPSDILGTPYGYSPMFDLLPIQDAVNSLYSTVMTNNNAFGVQNILSPEGANIKVNQLEGGLNFIEYTPLPGIQSGGKPESLQLVNSSSETYNLLGMLERTMETISGVNSVARGNPESSLKSGTALALVQSQALQFMSGLQQSYIQLLEDVGTGLIGLLKQFAKVPRMAAIVGINNSTKLVEFKSDDIEDINRVVVDVGNALMQTTAGRAQVAENLLQMMPEKMTAEKYLQVLNTGNLDVLTEGTMNELDTIKDENELLIKGGKPVAIATDHHAMHIREHRQVLANHKLREDAELVDRTLAHIMEHINLMRSTDPDLLAIIGEQPLAPQGGSPIAQQPQTQVSAEQPDVASMMQPDATPQGATNLPEPAAPPAPFQNAPQKPEDLV